MKAIGFILGVLIAILMQLPIYFIIDTNINNNMGTVHIACYIYSLFIIAIVSQNLGLKFYNWFKSKLK